MRVSFSALHEEDDQDHDDGDDDGDDGKSDGDETICWEHWLKSTFF